MQLVHVQIVCLRIVLVFSLSCSNNLEHSQPALLDSARFCQFLGSLQQARPQTLALEFFRHLDVVSTYHSLTTHSHVHNGRIIIGVDHDSHHNVRGNLKRAGFSNYEKAVCTRTNGSY